MQTLFSSFQALKITKKLFYRLLGLFVSLVIIIQDVSPFQIVQADTAEWIPQGRGPGGTSVLAIAADPETPSTLYAGTNFGIYKSTDSGDTWTNTTSSLLTFYGDIPSINTIAIHPLTNKTLYVGCLGGGVFKSIDAGKTWVTINNGITTLHVHTVVIDPQNPEILYAGTMGFDSQGGIFKTNDGGKHWGAVNMGLPVPAYVYSILIDPQNPNNIYAALSDSGIYRSTNRGASWTAINTGPSLRFIRALAIEWDTDTIYAGTANLGFLKSIDGGETFTQLNSGINSKLSIATIWLAHSATIYVGTEDGGIYASSNGGDTWAAINSGLNSFYINAFIGTEMDPSVYFAGTRGGVFKLSDNEDGWKEFNVGLPAAKTEALMLLPQEQYPLFAGTAGSGVYRFQDPYWIPESSGISTSWIRTLAYDPIKPTTLYAGTFFGGVFKSLDGGATWTEKNTGLPPYGRDVREIIVHPVDSRILYIGIQSGVYKSLDGGDHWTGSSEGIPFNSREVRALAMDGNHPETMYVGNNSGVVYKTIDGGNTWQASSTGLTGIYLRDLAVDPNQFSVVYAGAEGNLFRSTDSGASWELTDLKATATSIIFDLSNPETLFAGTEGWGVYRSTDDGLTWELITMNGLPVGKSYVYDLVLDSNTQMLYAATEIGTAQLLQGGINGNSEPLQSNYLDVNNGALDKSLTATVNTYGVFALCVSEECLAPPSTSLFVPMLIRSSQWAEW